MDRLAKIQQWCRTMEAGGMARGRQIVDCDVHVGPDETLLAVARTVGNVRVDWAVADLDELLTTEPQWHLMDEFQDE